MKYQSIRGINIKQ